MDSDSVAILLRMEERWLYSPECEDFPVAIEMQVGLLWCAFIGMLSSIVLFM